MKLSYDWLQEFVELSETDVNTVSERLTMGAFEVEGIETIGDELKGEIVLGQIKEISKHPDADKIQITQTSIGKNPDGSDNVQQIVCGGKNIAVGQLIPVATVGSKVFNRADGTELEIKKAKIRGVESFGMLCSAAELGYDDEFCKKIAEEQGDGIYLMLDPNNSKIKNRVVDSSTGKTFDLGTDIRKVLGIQKDIVLDVGARSNRGDALSVLGQAREIAALFSKEVKRTSLEDLDELIKKYPETLKLDKSIRSIAPAINDEKDCTVFHTLTIEGIKVCESPTWMQHRLEAMGTRSINSLVDISNYVLYELGQPTHFYDRDKLKSDKLTVKRAANGTKIKTLDDAEYEVSEKNLMIYDASEAVGIAGVMGGLDSQITDTTTSIVIESAAFSASTVRKSARAAGIESEAKKRFERGVDHSNSKAALLRCLELVALIAKENGQKLKISEVLTTGNPQAEKKTVKLRLSQIKRYLGIEVDKDTIVKLLKPLEIIFIADTKASDKDASPAIEFEIPSFRQVDVYREEDLIEEIARLYGYDKIPVTPPSSSVTAAITTEKEAQLENVQNIMRAHGFSQAILSSLVGEKLTSKEFARTHNNDLEVRMLNPLSREHSVLRQSMIPSLVQAASRNYAYDKTSNIKLFELGKIYFYDEKSKKKDTSHAPTEERERFTAIMISKNESWKQAKHEADDFYKFKAIIEELFPRAIFKNFADQDTSKLPFASLCHPGIAAVIEQDKRELGFIAKLHPSIAKEWDLPDHSFILEANLPKLKKSKFKPVANTPIIDRDITVDFKSDISSQAIIDLIKKSCSKDLIKVDLISLYQKDKDAPRSLSYRLKWQSKTETLTGELIDKEVKSIKEKLISELEASFRE